MEVPGISVAKANTGHEEGNHKGEARRKNGD